MVGVEKKDLAIAHTLRTSLIPALDGRSNIAV